MATKKNKHTSMKTQKILKIDTKNLILMLIEIFTKVPIL